MMTRAPLSTATKKKIAAAASSVAVLVCLGWALVIGPANFQQNVALIADTESTAATTATAVPSDGTATGEDEAAGTGADDDADAARTVAAYVAAAGADTADGASETDGAQMTESAASSANAAAATSDSENATPTTASTADADQNAVPGEIIVVYKTSEIDGDASLMETDDSLADLDVTDTEVVESVSDEDATIVKVDIADDENVDEAIDRLEDRDDVAFAQRNYIYTPSETTTYDLETTEYEAQFAYPRTNDTYASNQYYLDSWDSTFASTSMGANVYDAWSIAQAKVQGSVTVAVLDTGVDVTHEDLADRILTSYAYNTVTNVAGASAVTDTLGHGTHVSGLIAATADNGVGIAGSSYNANLLPIKIVNDSGTATTLTMVTAYDYLDFMMDHDQLSGLRVVNVSFNSYQMSDQEDELLEGYISRLRSEHNVLTVCSGGNGNSATGEPYTIASYPSDYPECLSVTALDQDGTNLAYSDYNLAKDISAPGSYIYSTVPTSLWSSGYVYMGGTSMAAPLVAGIAAMLWSVDADLTVDEAVAALTETANPLDPDDENYHDATETGSAGAVDAAAAVAKVAGVDKPVVRSLDDATLTFADGVDDPRYEMYDGTAKTPAVTVAFADGTTLIEGTDYVVAYENNTEPGIVTVTVTGTGAYKDRLTTAFRIASELQVDIATTVTGGYLWAAAQTQNISNDTPLCFYWQYSKDGETWRTSSVTAKGSRLIRNTPTTATLQWRCVVTARGQ